MGAAQPQISTDSRDRAQKLSRRQALDILHKRGIQIDTENIPLGTGFPDRYRGQTILKIMEAAGIDPNDPFPEVQWAINRGKDEHGNAVINEVPVRPQHQSAGKSINYDKLIDEQAQKTAEADAVIEAQASMMQDLLQRLETLEKNTVPLERLSPPQLKRVCKERGIDISNLKSKAELLKALES